MYKLFIILGGPASGKGTLSSILVKELNMFHVSPGDLLRSERNKGNLQQNMCEIMDNGHLLPASFIGDMILSYTQNNNNANKTVLLDGFPRDKDNYDYYNNYMKQYFDLLNVIVLDCSDDIMIRRIENRKLLGRCDDTFDICKKRIKAFREETEKIINLFNSNKIIKIDSSKTEHEMYEQFIKSVEL
ncbi:adenylate kinase [Klosneuvirus KNV1]|uniref:Adenylate kinase n=1 Tax=Klosneuvirus KNV1 TaxID=1977640 RepID=A0A1V0SK76_9VIRU|nr:adenylate kinase [Klosneuvirus KNV1]